MTQNMYTPPLPSWSNMQQQAPVLQPIPAQAQTPPQQAPMMPQMPVQQTPMQQNPAALPNMQQTLPAQQSPTLQNISAAIQELPTQVDVETRTSYGLPETLSKSIYTPGWMRTQIGKLMRVEFLIGNGTTDRVGYLREVGSSYIVLDSLERASIIMCDIYSIKFVTVIESPLESALLAQF